MQDKTYTTVIYKKDKAKSNETETWFYTIQSGNGSILLYSPQGPHSVVHRHNVSNQSVCKFKRGPTLNAAV